MLGNQDNRSTDPAHIASTCESSEVMQLETVRQRRAHEVAAPVSALARPGPMLIGAASALAAVALVTVYGMLLSRTGVSG